MVLRASVLSPEHQSANREGLNSSGTPAPQGRWVQQPSVARRGQESQSRAGVHFALCHATEPHHWTHLLYQNDGTTSDPYLQPQARLTNTSPCHSWPLAALCPCRATPQKVLIATNTIQRCLQRTRLRDELWESDFH